FGWREVTGRARSDMGFVGWRVFPRLSFFFFSSRRRHTRSYGDWSSDVCSSDLRSPPSSCMYVQELGGDLALFDHLETEFRATIRSEERRVGKECRERRCRYQ